MKIKGCSKTAICAVMTTSLLVPHFALSAPAAGAGIIMAGIFDTNNSSSGSTGAGSAAGAGGSTTTSPRTTNTTTSPVQNTASNKMQVAKVPDAFACPIFDNGPHKELLSAIDSLSLQIAASKECSGDPSVTAIKQNGETIKQQVEALQNVMMITDPNQVNTANIDASITSALGAVQNIGNVLSNNAFLNSKCGSETMTTGKALLAFNDIINGLSPYALFAVSMNAALAPALPFVIGGIVATSGISVLGKMIDDATIDMTNPTHRKAVVVNTCQFVKISKKVRFMQLAQSGKIERISQELEKSVSLYNAQFAKPTASLNGLLSYKDSHEKNFSRINTQLTADLNDIKAIEDQLKINNDDLMVCTLSNELANWASDGQSFPVSAVINLDTVTKGGGKTQQLQAITMKTHYESARRKVVENALKASESEDALKSCAAAGRSWISGLRQTLTLTSNALNENRRNLDQYLAKNPEYKTWKAQFILIENQKNTVARVEKAMTELAKDDSIIDRSELSQRINGLKSGLFGNGKLFKIGKSPVKAWIDHTRSMYDRSMASFLRNLNTITQASFNMTQTGKGENVIFIGSTPFSDPIAAKRDRETAANLGNLNLKVLPMGSRQNELACRQLENAWLEWSASIDHLGAIQYFCDMIDPVIDAQMDSGISMACRGQETIAGKGYVGSLVNSTRQALVKKGFQKKANIISSKMKELKCPMPSVTVMNN